MMATAKLIVCAMSLSAVLALVACENRSGTNPPPPPPNNTTGGTGTTGTGGGTTSPP